MFLRLLWRATQENPGENVLDRPNTALERPSHLAARFGSAEMVQCLIQRGADVCAGDLFGHNTLMTAADANNVDAAALVVAHVMNRGAEPVRNTNVARRRWFTLKTCLPDITAAVWSYGVDPTAPDGAARHAMAAIAAQREGGSGGIGGGGRSSMAEFLSGARAAYMRRQRDRYVNTTSSISGYSALHIAAEKGFSESVQLLLDSGAHPDLPDNRRGNCALHLAVRDSGPGCAPTVAALVAHGASLRTRNDLWYTPLHLAARHGNFETLAALLDAADAQGITREVIDMPRKDGTSPLHSAVESSYQDIVKELLARGAFWNAKTTRNETVLHIAARAGHAGIVRSILACRAQAITELRDDGGPSREGMADDEDIIKGGGGGTDIGMGDSEGLSLAGGRQLSPTQPISGLSLDGGRQLSASQPIGALSLDNDRQLSPTQPIGGGTGGGRRHEVELVDDPVQLRDHTESMPLHWAADGGHLTTVQMLVEAGAPINMGGMWRGSTAVHLSARNGHVEVVRYLHSRGANMNAQDMWNYATPLILAAEGGHSEVIRFLLDRRVRIGVKDKFGTTAAQNARTPLVRHLIRSTQIVRNTALALCGASRTDLFLRWRDHVLDSKS